MRRFKFWRNLRGGIWYKIGVTWHRYISSSYVSEVEDYVNKDNFMTVRIQIRVLEVAKEDKRISTVDTFLLKELKALIQISDNKTI
jgi:hypothetical protein